MSAAIFEAVLGNLAVSAALGFVALGVSRWTNRPAIAHALWLLVLIKLVTPPIISIPVQCLPAKADVTFEKMSLPQQPPVTTEPMPVVLRESATHASNREESGAATFHSASVDSAPLTLLRPSRTTGVSSLSWPSWESLLLGLWASGVLISVAIVARRVTRFSRLLRFASPAPDGLIEEVAIAAKKLGLRNVPRVRVIPGEIAPLVWAVGLPTLYFPIGLLTRLSSEQRLSLITHELAHIRRWDHIVRVIEFGVLAVYWWCPLAWIARRELRRLEEEACDADVLASAPGSAFVYASAIVETIDYLAGVAPAPRLASGIGEAHSLRRRLVLILSPNHPAQTTRITRFMLVLAGVVILTACPKLARLTASIMDVSFGAPSPGITASSALPVALDEAFVEQIHFLPTPVQLLKANESGDTSITVATLSPNGSRLAMAVAANVQVWDVATKRLLFALTGHADSINAVVFSPDGSRIATVANDTFGIIWDASDGRRLQTLAGHAKWVLCAAFSPDGRTLATGGYDKTIRIWETSSGREKAVWTGHGGGVRSIAFSPGGQTVATGGADNEIHIWDANRGVTTKILKKHCAPIRVVAFSPNGTRLASGSEDRTVQVWNSNDGREVGSSIPLPDFVSTLAFSVRGQALFAGTLGGHLLNINPENGRARGYVGVEPGKPAGSPAHEDAIVSIQTSAEGKALYSVSQDGLALAWPSAGPPQISRLVFRGHHPMTAVALSPNGTTLATAGQDGIIHLWDAATAKELMTLPGHIGGVSSLMFGAGTRLVSAGADERVRVWDISSGRPVYTVIQTTAELCIALSPDGLRLAIGGRKLSGITLVDLAKGGKPFRFGESAGEVTSLAFTPGGERLASGSAKGWIRIWDSATGEEIFRSPAGNGSVDGISFSPDSTVAAIVLNGVPRLEAETESGPNHEVVFLDAHDGSILDGAHPLAHPATITAAAFTTENTVLTAAHDGNLYLWDIKTARVLRIINGHVDSVKGVALIPDGTAVFSAGDRAAKKWTLEATGEK